MNKHNLHVALFNFATFIRKLETFYNFAHSNQTIYVQHTSRLVYYIECDINVVAVIIIIM